MRKLGTRLSKEKRVGREKERQRCIGSRPESDDKKQRVKKKRGLEIESTILVFRH